MNLFRESYMQEEQKNHRFSFGKEDPDFFKICFITGMCRAGKTLLGNIISASADVEYAEEPWLLQYLPLVHKFGKIDQHVASGMFSAFLLELYKDIYLLRAANFRKTDLSYIGRKKTEEEIEFRLNSTHTIREVYQYGRGSVFVVNLAETIVAHRFLTNSIPNAKIIHVSRHPYGVALDIMAKGWFADTMLLNPTMASPFIKCRIKEQIWYLPWWVPEGKEEYFLSLSEKDRAVYYWLIMTLAVVDLLGRKNIFHITYEDIIYNVQKNITSVFDFLGIGYRDLVGARISEVRENNIPELAISDTNLKDSVIHTIGRIGYNYQV